MKYFHRSLANAALIIALILGLHAVSGAQQAKTPLTMPETVRLLIAGRAMSADEAGKLEKTLDADPQNLAARVSLIAFYAAHHDEPSNSKKDDQALWFIRNLPDSEILQSIVQVRLHPVIDKQFAAAKQLWLDNLDKYKGNATVIGNAVDFFTIPDKPLTEKLINEAAELEPTNPRWPMEFGNLLMMETQRANPEARRDIAARAYEEYSRAYSMSGGDRYKPFILTRLPEAAFEAGDLKHAREWALEILSQAAGNQRPTLLDGVHHAQIVLGRVALVNGDLKEAKERLMLAGQTAGSPALNSFGPNMALAKELLDKGERETVIKYFQECAAFWMQKDKLDQWTAQVKAGETPQFGANLIY